MPQLPNAPRKGDAILDWARGITAYLRSLQPRGLGVRQTSGGLSVYQIPPVTGRRSNPAPAAAKRPLTLYPTTTSDSDNPLPRIGITPGTLAGEYPEQMTASGDPPFLLAPVVGESIIRVHISYDENMDITARKIEHGDYQAPANGEAYHILGAYTFDGQQFTAINNSGGYGPIEADICPNYWNGDGTFTVVWRPS